MPRETDNLHPRKKERRIHVTKLSAGWSPALQTQLITGIILAAPVITTEAAKWSIIFTT